MILAVDIGNTHSVLGIFENDELKLSIRLATDRKKTADELEFYLELMSQKRGFDIREASGSIVSSVVPNLNRAIREALLRITKKEPIIVGPGVKSGLNILYDDPKEVGADRIVNAVGALKRHKAPLIIIDSGTATTYCVIDRKNNYLGGVISPGLKISSEALFERAAKLPKVELTFPKKVLNANTVDAIRAGLMYSLVGEVEYMVKKLKEEVDIDDAKVIATGGISKLLKGHTDVIDHYEDDLTLWGLKAIYEKNATV